ncbi:class I adenylate-forming enzyme family protein [Novosphingobium sp. FSW06-99]|uniref:class I adenylate-forming enzyme family protein n=1 Tax=Novosphingobium sp. FSW06-99 TaxID=1739113 RepID=UPI00076C4C90|nr:AMP-binding protein [Novosphingobium sp. FSW06-99]KUR74666.1 fatty acid--CoA ligase [Novosphingobium sp. FSW06-99]
MLTLDEARNALCAPGAPFEMVEVAAHGRTFRAWKNAPADLGTLARIGRAHGTRDFLVYEDERVSFEGWFRAVAALAQHLRDIGVGPGDRVALAMRNVPEWPVVFFAVTTLGAICVPLNAWWTGAELTYGLNTAGASVLIADAERIERIVPLLREVPSVQHVFGARMAEARPGVVALETVIGRPGDYGALQDRDLPQADLAPDLEATIFYTSGTTGHPKGALGTHRNLATNILSSAYVAASSCLRRGEVPPPPSPRTALVSIPLFHVTACSAVLMGSVYAGNTLVFMRRWDAGQALALIERERINLAGGVPTIAWQLLEHPDREKYDLSSLETVSYGGAPSAPDLVRKISAVFGARPGNGWGMTETMATVTNIVGEDYLARPDSCGPAVAVADLRVVDPDTLEDKAIGEVGELWARGPMVVKGYWENPQATEATFVEGWVRTGDLARLDPDGYCYIVDRAKDIVIRGGENIYSAEVENALYDHPAVMDAAVIGIPHHTLGEEPAAVVHLSPGHSATEADLRAWVGERLAAFKVPVAIRFHAETLPRNANGKILKRDLKALFS